MMKTLHSIFMPFMLMVITAVGQAATLPRPLVDVAWLKANSNKVVILDVRSDIKSFTAKPVFRKDKKTGKLKLVKVAGHIPGARLVNFKKLRTTRKIGENEITRVLPEKNDFEAVIRSVGLNAGDSVVIVSKGVSGSDMTSATRLYWSLKYFGQDDMAILDGGMAQWLKEGGKVTSSADKPKKGNWIATAERKEILASSDDIRQAIKDNNVQLVDTRPVSQYLGTYRKSYVYADGHIPGAKNLPDELLTGPKGKAKFTSVEKLQKLSDALGINAKGTMITYCNSGNLATGSWFLYHEVMGNKNAKMYDGSLHQWTKENGDTVDMKVE
jgi:thiosulfate/3-mercaptopyruvate sulfurtransferase